MKKLLIVQVAGLDLNGVRKSPDLAHGLGLEFREYASVFPAVTCTAAATMRTGLSPAGHGIICNGRYDRNACKVEFWCQSARLIHGERIWAKARLRGAKVGVLFTQQSLGDETDYALSPAPIHKHHGGMIQSIHTKPPRLESELTKTIGWKFNLANYWGPLASGKSSTWCAESTAALMTSEAPEILFSYLPHMDYCQQKEGPDGPSAAKEFTHLAHCLEILLRAAKAHGYEVVVWGDYAITAVEQPVFPNAALLEAGLFQTRDIQGMLYPNLYDSRAFAICDHQIAHVFIHDPADIPKVRAVLETLPGVESVQTPAEAKLECPESGELVLTAAKGAWFAYSWWQKKSQAPDYATHVDIHNKIGFDPCELFWGIPFLTLDTDARRVKGSHGRIDAKPAFAVTDGLSELRSATSQIELSNRIRMLLDNI